jgi:hypothetical protein
LTPRMQGRLRRCAAPPSLARLPRDRRRRRLRRGLPRERRPDEAAALRDPGHRRLAARGARLRRKGHLASRGGARREVPMEERRTPLRTGTAKAAFLAALSAALLLVPTFWFIGVLHFGLITGIDPTTGRIVSYIVWTSILGVLLFAYILRRYVRRLGSRHLGFGRSCVVAAVALAPMQAATWHVTATSGGTTSWSSSPPWPMRYGGGRADRMAERDHARRDRRRLRSTSE